MADKYCYPDSTILQNKLNIHDKNTLLQAEIELTSARLFELQEKSIKGNFDFNHLCKIHKYIFQDLFSWAGKPRTVDIGKGNIFCFVQNIPSYANSIFSRYYDDCQSAKHNKEKFVHILTEHYADLNALHPFREGNGRTQREFTRELCLNCGYTFDLTKTCHEEMLHASIASFNGNNRALENIFQTAIQPITDYTKHQDRLRNLLTTMSIDDIPTKDESFEI